MPKRIEGLQGVRAVAISAGDSHSLVLAAGGAVYSFGYGSHGKLGHGDVEEVTTPKRIEALRSVRAVAVSAGFTHNLVLSAAGEVYSFGHGDSGALGHGDQDRQSPPSAQGEV